MNEENFPDIQQMIADFVREHDLEAPVPARALDLASETGELAKEVLKGTGYGRRPYEITGSWSRELGDVLFTLICLANSTGVELEAALEETLEKYRDRLASGGDAGSGG